MAKAPKMVRLAIDETSGVDHPAHLTEGWMVMKSTTTEEIDAVLDSLSTESNTQSTKEDSVSDESTVVTEDAEVVEAPAAEATPTESPAEDVDAKIAELEAELEKAKASKPDPMAQMVGESDADYAKRMKEMKMSKSATNDDDSSDIATLKKSASAPIVKAMESLEKAAADAIATLKKERDERADAEAVAKAKAWSNLPLDAEKVGPALRQLSQINEELAKSIEGILSSVNEQAKTSNLFAEIGKSVDAGTDAYSRMSALAKAAVESGVAKSMEQAMADVAIANADLYSQYLSEKGAK
jgi:hypothetical protein